MCIPISFLCKHTSMKLVMENVGPLNIDMINRICILEDDTLCAF